MPRRLCSAILLLGWATICTANVVCVNTSLDLVSESVMPDPVQVSDRNGNVFKLGSLNHPGMATARLSVSGPDNLAQLILPTRGDQQAFLMHDNLKSRMRKLGIRMLRSPVTDALLHYAVVNSANEICGVIGGELFSPEPNTVYDSPIKEFAHFRIFYALGPSARGAGLIKPVVREIITRYGPYLEDVGFKIIATPHADSAASIAVLESLGFVEQKVFTVEDGGVLITKKLMVLEQ